MNEELLKLVYSKLKTKASFEDFKKDFNSNESLRRLGYSKLKTKASYEDFIKDVGFSSQPKKEQAVSTESQLDSAQQSSTSGTDPEVDTGTNQQPESFSKGEFNLAYQDISEQPPKRNPIQELYDYEDSNKNAINEAEIRLHRRDLGKRDVLEGLDETTISDYENWKGQETLTEEDMAEVDKKLEELKSDDIMSHLNFMDRLELGAKRFFSEEEESTRDFIERSNYRKAQNMKTRDELIKEKIERKRIDYLDKLDDPKRRRAVLDVVAKEKFNNDQYLKDIETLSRRDQLRFEAIKERADRVLETQGSINEALEKAESQEQFDAILAESVKNAEEYDALVEEQQNVISQLEVRAEEYENYGNNIGTYEQELDLLKKNYQWLDNQKRTLQLSFAERHLARSYATGSISLDEAKTYKKYIDDQRSYIGGKVNLEYIDNVGDALQFIAEANIDSASVLPELAVPGGQQLFFATQASLNHLDLIIKQESTREEIRKLKNALKYQQDLDPAEILSYSQKLKQLEEVNQLSGFELAASSFASAGVETALMSVVGKGATIKRGKRFLKSIPKNKLKPGLDQAYYKILGKEIFEVAKSAGGEFKEEAGIAFFDNIKEMYWHNEWYKENGKDRSIIDNVFERGVSGAASGGGLTTAVRVLGHSVGQLSTGRIKNKVANNTLKFNEYLEKLKDPSLDLVLRAEYIKEAQRLKDENTSIMKSTLEGWNNLSDSDKKKVVDINDKLTGIALAISKIEKKDDDISKKTLGQLKERAQKLEEKKEELVYKNETQKKGEEASETGLPEEVSSRIEYLEEKVSSPEFEKEPKAEQRYYKETLRELKEDPLGHYKSSLELYEDAVKTYKEDGKQDLVEYYEEQIKYTEEIIKSLEDGSKQPAQETTKASESDTAEATSQESVETTEAETTVEGREGQDSVREEDGSEPGVGRNDEGVRGDSVDDKKDSESEGVRRIKPTKKLKEDFFNDNLPQEEVEGLLAYALDKKANGKRLTNFEKEMLATTEPELIQDVRIKLEDEQKAITDAMIEARGKAIENRKNKKEDSKDKEEPKPKTFLEVFEEGADKAIDFLDNLDKKIKDHGDSNLSMGLPVVAARGVIAVMKSAVKAGKTSAQVVQAGVDYIKGTEWYAKLSDADKKDIEDNLMDRIRDPEGKATDRETVEFELDKKVNEGMTLEEAIDSFDTPQEKMLATDIAKRREKVDPKKAYETMVKSFDKTRAKMHEKKRENFLSKGLRKFALKSFDRQYLPKMLLNRAGGRLIRNYMITAKGAPGYAKYMFEKAYEKIYKGLSDKDIKTLDMMIQQLRFIAIDKNREKRGIDPVVHPDFQNRETSQAALEELKGRIGEKKYKDLEKRANAYFDEFRMLLDEMEKSGLVSKKFRDEFFDVDYQPRRFLQFLNTQEQTMSIVEMGVKADEANLGSKQIRALEKGSNESLVTDSMYLLQRSMNARASAIAMNNTVNKLAEFLKSQKKKVDELRKKDKPTRKERKLIKYFDKLSEKVKVNPIVKITDGGNPKYKYKVGSGQKAQSYYVNGVKHQVIMEEAFFDQFNDNLKGVFKNPNAKERVALFSLSALVKAIATGHNPMFMFTNTPRDFMFIATFSEEYGGFIPFNMVKIIKDTTLGVRDIMKDKKYFQAFVKNGGMLDYLHKQGEFKGTTGTKRFIDKAFNNRTQDRAKSFFNWATLNKLQMYSEIGFRMGVFRRSISNQLKELGLKNIEDATPEQQQDIYTNAAASARNTTDFSQGGLYVKDADAIVPYLNAGVQGTRVAVESFGRDPVFATLRVVQSATMLSAIPILVSVNFLDSSDDEEDKDLTGTERYFKALKGVSLYDKTNYMIFFTGDKDEDGNYNYIRIAKPHFMTPFISYAQSLQHNLMKSNNGLEGKEDPTEAILFALEKNISPVELSPAGNAAKNPLLKASLTYMTGYDFYRNQDLSYLKGDVPVPVEGHESKSVEQFYKDLGEEHMISPARMKGAVESIITTPSTSPFVGILYGGADVVVSDGDIKENIEKIRKSFVKSFSARLFKTTSEFNSRVDWDKKFEKEFAKKEIEVLKEKAKIKELANEYKKGNKTNEDINKEFDRLANKDVFEAKRLMNTFNEVVSNPKGSVTIIDLKFRKPAQRAIILASIFGDKLLQEGKELSKENKKLRDELFSKKILNPETIAKYNDLIEDVNKGGK